MAATTRTSVLIVSFPPTRSNCWSCSTRSTFACVAGVMSPISSRKSVPPSACSNLPMRLRSAPVNAPFSWPNSSLSRSDSGIAAQLIARNGFVGAGGVLVDRAGDEFLAGAALAEDQHRHVLRGDAADRLVHLLHGRASGR